MNNNSNTIVETLVSDTRFGTLVQAVTTAGLLETLQGIGPFTLLAPTNEAFAKLPQTVMDSLLDPDNLDRLKEVLMYHVISGSAVKAAELTDKQVINMANGDTAMVNLAQATQFVFPRGSATVIEADIMASNGIIHVLDKVMMPK